MDNRESDFTDKDNPIMKWESYLHKGSGKKAKKIKYSNKELKKHIKKTRCYEQFINELNNQFNGKINNSLDFLYD